jgi:5-methylcytosine-specific restriction endonuclease McrA
MVPRPCAFRFPDRRGCPSYAEPGKSYCAEHQRENWRTQRKRGTKRSAGGEWAALRAAVLERDHHRCQLCAKTEQELRDEGNVLEVHHRDGDHENNDLSNLQALCRTPCHRQIAQPAARRARLEATRPGRRR